MLTASRIIKELFEGKSRTIQYHQLWLKTYCPYTFINSNVEKDQVLPLNREYLPLGIFPYKSDFTEEESILYQVQIVPKELIDIDSCPKQIGVTGSDDIIYYLYHDGNSPWYSLEHLRTYYDALCKLIKQ
jgi:hypothetical protein